MEHDCKVESDKLYKMSNIFIHKTKCIIFFNINQVFDRLFE